MRKKRKTAGFTLIEVLISLTVFIIGIVLLFPLFSGGLQMLGDIDAQTTVANLARMKMTEIEAIGFRTSPSNISRTAFPSPYDDFDYEIQWSSVANDIVTSNQILYEVSLTIYWSSSGGEKNQTFLTYLSRQRPI